MWFNSNFLKLFVLFLEAQVFVLKSRVLIIEARVLVFERHVLDKNTGKMSTVNCSRQFRVMRIHQEL